MILSSKVGTVKTWYRHESYQIGKFSNIYTLLQAKLYLTPSLAAHNKQFHCSLSPNGPCPKLILLQVFPQSASFFHTPLWNCVPAPNRLADPFASALPDTPQLILKSWLCPSRCWYLHPTSLGFWFCSIEASDCVATWMVNNSTTGLEDILTPARVPLENSPWWVRDIEPFCRSPCSAVPLHDYWGCNVSCQLIFQFVIFPATVASLSIWSTTTMHANTPNLFGETFTFIRQMHSCGRGNGTFSWCFHDLLWSRNVKSCIWFISYLSDLEVGREFSSSLHDLWLLQKCEIEYMNISILPYDNISNWRDLGVWRTRVLHTQLVPGKMEMAAYQTEITLQAEVTRQ